MPQKSGPFAAPCWPSYEENGPLSEEISFSPRNVPVRAFDCPGQGFSTPLARRRSSCPPPTPNVVHTHSIERCCALPGFPRQSPLPLARHHLPKRTRLELGRGAPGEHHPQPNIPPSRLNRPAEPQRQPVKCMLMMLGTRTAVATNTDTNSL